MGGEGLAEVPDYPQPGVPTATPLEEDTACDDTTPIVLEDLDT